MELILFLCVLIIKRIFSSEIDPRNDIYTIGFNNYALLCDEAPDPDDLSSPKTYFPSSSKHIIANYPSNNVTIGVLDHCLTQYNSFFLMENGVVYGSGYETYLGVGYDSPVSVKVPISIDFGDSNFHPTQILCSQSFTIFCNSSFDECLGIGNNYNNRLLGRNIPEIVFAATTIFSGDLLSFRIDFPTYEIKKIYTGVFNTLVLFRNDSGTKNVLYGAGKNDHGILSNGISGVDKNSWLEMTLPLKLSCLSEIKLISILSFNALYVITNDNIWYYSGESELSTCESYGFTDLNYLTEIPHTTIVCSTSNGVKNELIGKNIIDLKCSFEHCISLTNESRLYSWGKVTNENIYGRNHDWRNIYSPLSVNMTLFSKINEQRQEEDFMRIQGIFIQTKYSFVDIFDPLTERKRIFAFGEWSEYFDFGEHEDNWMFEVFQNYTLSPHYSSISRGDFMTYALVILPYLCTGDYRNENCSGRGTCYKRYGINTCKCEDGYGNDHCEEIVCYGIPTSFPSVCGGNGECVEYDHCECWFKDYDVVSPEDCSFSYCFGYGANDSRVCTYGNGKCIAEDKCECTTGAEADNCSAVNVCFGIRADVINYDRVCNGHGTCVGEDDCNCESLYFGDECEKELYSLVAIFSAIFGSSVVLLVLFFCCIFMVCCFLILLVSLPITIYVFTSKKKIKTFKSIKNLDLIMEEQQLEENMDIAHLTINKEIFNLDIDKIHLIELIGSGGSQSKVYKAKFKGQIYAFKRFFVNVMQSQEIFEEFEREVSILGSFRHKNILGFFGACIKAPRIGILMEFCSNGDLKRFLRKYKEEHKGTSYSTNEKFRMIHEIASAIYHLHESNVIHRDIKLENVLVDDHEVTKLMDFGLSRTTEERDSKSMTRGIGTSVYMSPELIRGEQYDSSVDAYAFGILCWIVLTEQYKCYGEDEEGIEFKVANNPFLRPNLKAIEGVNWIHKLIRSCWDHEHVNRPTFEEILSFLEKKKDESIVIYYLFNDSSSFENVNEQEAEDYFLKEKTMNELKKIIIQNKRNEEDYSIFIQHTKGVVQFKELKNQKDLNQHISDDCLIVFMNKSTSNNNNNNEEEKEEERKREREELEMLKGKNEELENENTRLKKILRQIKGKNLNNSKLLKIKDQELMKMKKEIEELKERLKS